MKNMQEIKNLKTKKYFKLLIVFVLIIIFSQLYYIILGEKSDINNVKNGNCASILLGIKRDLVISNLCREDSDCILVGNSGCPGEFCTNKYAVNKEFNVKYKIEEKMDYYTKKCTEAFEGHCWGCEYFDSAICKNGFCKAVQTDDSTDFNMWGDLK